MYDAGMVFSRWSKLLAAVVLGSLSLAFACQSKLPEGSQANRVVMVSYDGVGADLARQWIEAGVAQSPDGLAGMARHGLAVQRLRMADPTVTAVSHFALVTGQTPSVTGIVGNVFRLPGTPIDQTVTGFSSPSQADTLWTAARRQGVRVGTLLWPGTHAGALDSLGDFGVLWPGLPLVPSEIIELDPELAGTTGELMSKDGVQPLVWPLHVELPRADPAAATFEIATYDGTPDGKPRYDTLAARRSDDPSWQLAGEREWFDITFEAQAVDDLRPHPYAVAIKALHLDRFRGAIRLYRAATWRLRAYPDGFESRLAEAVGPWPGMPDEKLLAEWWLDYAHGVDLDTFLEQIERLDAYLDRVAAWVLAEEDFRLLLAYHPTPDQYQHSSLIVSPNQWGFSPGKAVAAREGLKRVGRSVDRSVAALWRALDEQRDALVVVSDHGHVPVSDEVNINQVLAEAGLLEVDRTRGAPRVASSSPMAVAAGGGVAHIYLNQIGREPDGVVSRASSHELLMRAARALADLTTEAGEPVVERAFTRVEAAEIGLDHPSSGDLIAFLKPGFAFSSAFEGAAIVPSRYYSQHGFLASHDAMCGMLFVRGAGVKAGSRKEVHVTEIAPFVARWLGIALD